MKFGYKNHSLPLDPSVDPKIFHVFRLIYEIFTDYFMP